MSSILKKEREIGDTLRIGKKFYVKSSVIKVLCSSNVLQPDGNINF